MIKGCSNCKFLSRSVKAEPCGSCSRQSEWVAEWDAKTELKTYEQGLNEAWEAARKISSFGASVQKELYGCYGLYFIAHEYTAQSAIAKLKDYENRVVNKFQVGDEVLSKAGYYGVVTRIEDNEDCMYVLFRDGSCGIQDKQYWEKTGKHFEDIKNFLATKAE